jgi:hypothetical protein
MERDKKAGHVSDKKDKRHGLDRETLFITLFSMFLFPNFFPIAGVFSSLFRLRKPQKVFSMKCPHCSPTSCCILLSLFLRGCGFGYKSIRLSDFIFHTTQDIDSKILRLSCVCGSVVGLLRLW